jgi:16S rRNA C967 or C1407 C5-methylase (RsmB/RsmF family)
MKTFKDKATRAGVDNFRILSDSHISEVKGLDSVLVEAPSSHLGAIGAHPEAKWRFHKEDLGRIQKVQAALLREGARKLKLGGFLIYATNTLNKSENEMQIEHFLRSTHNSYRLVPALSYLKESIVPYVTNFFNFNWDEKTLSSFGEFDPYFFLSPDIHGTSGTFAAIIQRTRIST